MNWVIASVVLLIIICSVISMFFALAETALFSVRKWQLRGLQEENEPAGQSLKELLSNANHLLSTLVLGTTFSNAAIILLGVWGATQRGWPLSLGTTFLLLLLLILCGCEILPKTFAVRRPVYWALKVAIPMRKCVRFLSVLNNFSHRLVSGLLKRIIPQSVRPNAMVSDEEVEELFELGYQQGSLGLTEKEFLLEIIDLEEKTARDVMKPRAHLACISDESSREQMLAAARKYRHRRLPVFDETPDTIVGILNTRFLLLNPTCELEEAIEFPSFVPESMNLLVLFQSLQKQRRGLAVVIDEYGNTAGVVTMEDILEEVVGEIRSEGEVQGFIVENLGPGRWRAHGTMRIDDFQRDHPPLDEVEEVDTLGGLLVHLCGVVPKAGEFRMFRGLKLTALESDERRVRELMIEKVDKRKL